MPNKDYSKYGYQPSHKQNGYQPGERRDGYQPSNGYQPTSVKTPPSNPPSGGSSAQDD